MSFKRPGKMKFYSICLSLCVLLKRLIMRILLFLYVLLLSGNLVFASDSLSLNRMFSDHMVLQRDKRIVFFGTNKPGEVVDVFFNGITRSTTTNLDGEWSVSFRPMKSNSVSNDVVVQSGDCVVRLRDVLIGDVWLLTGQSNMEWPLKREMHYSTELTYDHDLLRINNPVPVGRNVYGVQYSDALLQRLNTTDFYKWEGWQPSNRKSAAETSAVGFYFAEKIIAHTGVPVGIINLSIGGAPLESFLSTSVMEAHPVFRKKVSMTTWLNNDALPSWIRERGSQNVGSISAVFEDERGPNHAYKPGFAYSAGVKPLLKLPVKGVLLYQGESNAQEPERIEEYRDLQRLMIQNYRDAWADKRLPFYWVQLSSIDTLHYRSHYWPWFRNEQRLLAEEVRYAGMVVSSDHGARNDVHPSNKKVVGERLARLALARDYKLNIAFSGPGPRKAVFRNGILRVYFYNADGLSTSDGQGVRGFSMDGTTFYDAQIDKNMIVIYTDQKPEFVYYAWQPYTDANLVNAAGLPASTFKLKVQ
jgi:sialate O-acetylesterase